MQRMIDNSFEMFIRDRKYWVRFFKFNSAFKELMPEERNTQIPSKEIYRARAEKRASHIVKENQLGKKIIQQEAKNMVYTKLEVVSGSRKENTMKLIRIRKNKIYFDFYYLDPISGTKKRHQSSAGLNNSIENQIIAQQQALGRYHALSQLGKPKVEPPKVQPVSSTLASAIPEKKPIKTFTDLFEEEWTGMDRNGQFSLGLVTSWAQLSSF